MDIVKIIGIGLIAVIIIVILNTLISTIQEIYSKRTIDKLSFLAQTKTKVIREGKIEEISNFELVLDDVIELNSGNQIPTDSVILSGEIEVNESILTGEPDNIEKKKGDKRKKQAREKIRRKEKREKKED